MAASATVTGGLTSTTSTLVITPAQPIMASAIMASAIPAFLRLGSGILGAAPTTIGLAAGRAPGAVAAQGPAVAERGSWQPRSRFSP